MGLNEIWEKIKEMRRNREEDEDIDDDVTKDRYLRSLRRERRIQMEEVEKEQLKKDIAEYKKNRMRKHLFGIKDNIKQKQLINALNKKKEVKILAEKALLKDKKISKLKSESWLGKHDI